MQSTEVRTSRSWISPLTGISFLVIGITGILMFFHVRLPGMIVLHELSGLLFVIVTALHLKLNLRPLLAYCRCKVGRIALCIGTGLVGIFVIFGLAHDKAHQQRNAQAQPYEGGHHQQLRIGQ